MTERVYCHLPEVGETYYRVSDHGDDFRKQALVNVHHYGIERLLDQANVVETTQGKYEIIPFLFEAEGLRETVDGCHWIIPGGVATRVQLITEPSYQVTMRAVEGSGWLLRWHPRRGVNITWIDTKLGLRNPVVTSGYQWLVCGIANPEEKHLIIEGVDSPHFDPKFETELKPWQDRGLTSTVKDGWGERKSIYSLSEFWYHHRRLPRQEQPIYSPGP